MEKINKDLFAFADRVHVEICPLQTGTIPNNYIMPDTTLAAPRNTYD